MDIIVAFHIGVKVLSLLIWALYFLLLLLGVRGLLKSRQRYQKAIAGNSSGKTLSASIIIAVRNEMPNISALLQSLLTQQSFAGEYEIIIVDDHSTDGTCQWLQAQQLPQLKIISLEEGLRGKKEALAKGISQARFDILVFTDGDCLPEPLWLNSITKPFSNDQVQVVCGAVFIQCAESLLWHQLQFVEFLSPLAVSAATLGWSRASMANGASIAYRKTLYIEYQHQNGGSRYLASGDDMFLLDFAQTRFPGSIYFMFGKGTAVNTQPMASLTALLHQRIRWAGKWKHFKNKIVSLLAVAAVLVQVNWMATIALCMLQIWSWQWLAGIAVSKAMLEWMFLNSFAKEYGRKIHTTAYIMLQFIYPIYALVVSILSLAKPKYSWKGRIWPTK